MDAPGMCVRRRPHHGDREWHDRERMLQRFSERGKNHDRVGGFRNIVSQVRTSPAKKKTMKDLNSPDGQPFSRRQFIKSSSAALIAGAVTAQQLAAQKSSAETLRIGLIGCGGRGTGAAAQ